MIDELEFWKKVKREYRRKSQKELMYIAYLCCVKEFEQLWSHHNSKEVIRKHAKRYLKRSKFKDSFIVGPKEQVLLFASNSSISLDLSKVRTGFLNSVIRRVKKYGSLK